ncbi:FMN reductase [Mesorhizobium sp. BAC0120]|uniref:FMN reductase n=1 Tax=Mesorhizobium sp. BAC0120 TaxID=3090670 RepID=UPI00298BF556|nr:FMN reductase [Mesorhizobium sp. BAC0120]MDW6024170.1 FMN reductase [Mesorhizobium sp. BAC0120]
MPRSMVVGLSGNITRPSKTFAFVDHVANEIMRRNGLAANCYDIEALGPSFPTARRAGDLDRQARAILDSVVEADLLVVGSPTYKGSYTGLFKHFFDLLDPAALRGKPVVLTATGGGDRHALMVEHQLRPLFGFFEAFALPTAIYAAERDLLDGKPASEALLKRLAQVVGEAQTALNLRQVASIAAE